MKITVIRGSESYLNVSTAEYVVSYRIPPGQTALEAMREDVDMINVRVVLLTKQRDRMLEVINELEKLQ